MLENRLSLSRPRSRWEKTRALLGTRQQASALSLPSPPTEAQERNRSWPCTQLGEQFQARKGFSKAGSRKCISTQSLSSSASKKKLNRDFFFSFPVRHRAPPPRPLVFPFTYLRRLARHTEAERNRRRKEGGTGKSASFSPLIQKPEEKEKKRASRIKKSKKKQKVVKVHFFPLFSFSFHPLPPRHQRPARRLLLPLEEFLAGQERFVDLGGEEPRLVAAGQAGVRKGGRGG